MLASDADTIRILVATDNHVGYNERDAIRGDDSWKTFHEIMCLAKERDVDMVLLAGDLFHDNKPSRKSMYQVMRSLRMNCFGDKPCELEMLSDATENFQGAFNHVNYEDPDINVAIPVFSIHGNHDDPSGEGHLAALDLLQISGLLNYYGRTPESDNIVVKPVLLQKGRTKLALYGMSNVRDERLFRTFRDRKVKFFQPSTQKQNWFNLMSVHQNHHAYTETGFLPENFLPEFMDLVIWGHEHECLIDPKFNPAMNFHVMQPGSSVATSLMPGEAVLKHVAILSITGREFKSERIRLKTVRPFVMKEIVLLDEKGMKAVSKKDNNRPEITRYLESVIHNLIEQAKSEWVDAQEGSLDDDVEIPLPLVRLRVEYTAPEGGRFDCENPQRFSNRFVGKVANTNDVIQFYRKKSATSRKAKDGTSLPEESILAQLSIDTVKVEKLVREFLTAQSLTILPQNSFGDAVSQFVDKDDKHAMELFVSESLSSQIKHLVNVDGGDEDDIADAMEGYKSKLEELFAAGHLKQAKKANLKPQPDHWDSEFDGDWADQPGVFILSDVEDAGEDLESNASLAPIAAEKITPRKPNAMARSKTVDQSKPVSAGRSATTRATRTKKDVTAQALHDNADVIMIDDNEHNTDESDDNEQQGRSTSRAGVKSKSTMRTTKKAAVATRSSLRQTQLNLVQPPPSTRSDPRPVRGGFELSDDEISDDSDAFEPPSARPSKGRR